MSLWHDVVSTSQGLLATRMKNQSIGNIDDLNASITRATETIKTHGSHINYIIGDI